MIFEDYLGKITSVLNKIKDTQKEKIFSAAEMVSETIKNDGIIYIFGCGHSHLIALDCFYRAGGLANVSAMLDTDLMLHNGAAKSSKMEKMNGIAESIFERYCLADKDILITVSTSGKNAVPVEMAKTATKNGIKNIAVASSAYFPDKKDADMLSVIGRMKDGTIFSLDPSWSKMEERLPVPGPGWEVFPKRMEVNITLNCEKGTVMADCFGPNVYHNGCPNDRYTVQYTYFDEWVGLIDEFVDNIRNNKTPLINLKWHKRTIEAMNAVYESIATGKTVKL